MQARLKWNQGYHFTASVRNHSIQMDLSEAAAGGGNRGPSPKEFVLPAILGCTAMDVVAYLGKHKVPFESLDVQAQAPSRATQPRIFEHVELVYEIRGQGLEARKADVLRAVEESMTRYCSVSAMISAASPIAYKVRINDVESGSGQAKFDLGDKAPGARS